MRIKPYLFYLLISAGLLASCSEDDMDDVEKPEESPTIEGNIEREIRDFEYEAMSVWYLYNDEMPVYDDYPSKNAEYIEFLDSWDTPEDMFYDGLVYQYGEVDLFSWIVDDYEELENSFAGVSESSGMDFGLSVLCDGCQEVVGYVRYVIPNSPADEAGIERGMLFTEIDGQQLTVSNYRQLLYGSMSLTYGFADTSGNTVGDVTEEIEITKVTITENPVLIAKTIDVNGTNVGYLMYNSFTHDFDGELNDAFGFFKGEGIDELVLDLRYNGGGRITSAVDLASMITGQFEGEVITRTKYNELISAAYQDQFGAEAFVNRFDNQIYEYDDNEEFPAMAINSLNLERVYVLATGSTASASELIINGLSPYIDVVQVGTTTVGKVQASRTMYDSSSPNFGKTAALNNDHTYALQPLISTSTNANDEAYPAGLEPDIRVQESVFDYGVLGDPNERLLKAALDAISGNRRAIPGDEKINHMKMIGERGMEKKTYQKMYMDGLLPELDLEK